MRGDQDRRGSEGGMEDEGRSGQNAVENERKRKNEKEE